VLAVLAWFAGGPLGSGRLAAVGPSPWQVGVVAVLEVGVAAAISAGVANWLRHRSAGTSARPPESQLAGRGQPAVDRRPVHPGADGHPAEGSYLGEDGHVIYLNPWTDAGPATPVASSERPARPGPASLP
jgi:hypothetical protein